ncbi:hypothetical protein CW304_17870 [Bacillus sp. UFRGS-B20]|nr:hypothetical protein CW304_17870 [Bacillus sp. UFRGS-B20]
MLVADKRSPFYLLYNFGYSFPLTSRVYRFLSVLPCVMFPSLAYMLLYARKKKNSGLKITDSSSIFI